MEVVRTGMQGSQSSRAIRILSVSSKHLIDFVVQWESWSRCCMWKDVQSQSSPSHEQLHRSNYMPGDRSRLWITLLLPYPLSHPRQPAESRDRHRANIHCWCRGKRTGGGRWDKIKPKERTCRLIIRRDCGQPCMQIKQTLHPLPLLYAALTFCAVPVQLSLVVHCSACTPNLFWNIACTCM
jgi:hypothetical protein